MPNMPTQKPQLPIPTFAPTTVDAFRAGQDRSELRNGHFVEGRDDNKAQKSDD